MEHRSKWESRALLLRELREFFDSRGFLEVQPPCLADDCVVDAYLDPLQVHRDSGGDLDSSPDMVGSSSMTTSWYLQTSPESAMKQMLADGAPSIYSIGPVFRSGEQGPLHRVEFTMLEWYELGGTAATAIELLKQMAKEFLAVDAAVDTYRDLFLRHADLDPLEAPIESLVSRAAESDAALARSLRNDRDGLLDVILSQVIQPRLADAGSLVLTHYPRTQAALAKHSAVDPRCAERFEWFHQGIELANGYDELTDAEELVRRFEINNQTRVQQGRQPLPVETRLVRAMRSGMPACSGVAVGVDRLHMVIEGHRRLVDVQPMPRSHPF
ncbi:MAG: EF-P lysine aminoacylase EpmA [Planctomycetota bacterium]